MATEKDLGDLALRDRDHEVADFGEARIGVGQLGLEDFEDFVLRFDRGLLRLEGLIARCGGRRHLVLGGGGILQLLFERGIFLFGRLAATRFRRRIAGAGRRRRAERAPRRTARLKAALRGKRRAQCRLLLQLQHAIGRGLAGSPRPLANVR